MNAIPNVVCNGVTNAARRYVQNQNQNQSSSTAVCGVSTQSRIRNNGYLGDFGFGDEIR